MELNADFYQRAAVHAARVPWKPSPVPGVERRMLDRLGDEVARATTIVRFAPGSRFPAHVHKGGEEILVLSGVFQDEFGDFPAGSYIRNPPQSQHTPASAPGCTILVKLWQFDPADRTHVRIDTNKMPFIPAPGRPGVETMPLFRDACEDVRIERWAAGCTFPIDAAGGMEILVLEGSFSEAGEVFQPLSWLRLPKTARTEVRTSGDGARVWVKQGHLAVTPSSAQHRWMPPLD
ncbi:MAG: cupin domain-containing protein [Rhodomicrobium sp.]